MKQVTLIALIILALSQVAGQEKLTLQGAVDVALEHNYTLRAANHGLESANWGKRNAISNFLPRVELQSSLTRVDHVTERQANASLEFIKQAAGQFGIPQSALADIRPFVYRDTYSTGITVVQPIYNGGAEIIGVQAADAIQDRTRFAYEETEQDVIATVKSVYLNVLKAEELVALAKESADRTKRWLELTQRQAQLGSRTNTDVLRWEVQLAADEGNIVNAENALAIARLQLNEVMGVDLGAVYELEKVSLEDMPMVDAQSPSPGLLFASLQTSPRRGALDDSFLASHPSMRKMEANLRLADVNVDNAWTGFKPDVNLAFQYGWEKNNTIRLDGIRPWALSLSVSFPIFNGFGDYTRLQQVKAELQQATEQTESYRRLLTLQARNAELSVKSTRKRIEIARVGMKQAGDVLASVSRRYDLGAASNVDLIDAQTAYTSSKTSYITALYDNYIAEVQLAKATGRISR
jgi:outer membrane protein